MNKRLSFNIGLLAFALTAVLAVSLAFPALAAPPAQGDLLPTPTLFPVEKLPNTRCTNTAARTIRRFLPMRQ